MTKNKIHCLIINEAKSLKPALASIINNWEGKVFVEVINNSPTLIIRKLVKGNVNLVFTSSNDKLKLEKYRNLLRRYSNDTILINQSVKNRPLSRDLSGIESCSVQIEDNNSSSTIVSNLLNYTLIKKDFRSCKHLLSVIDQRNRWLVNITSEPIAYLYKGTHIHANAAYLSTFGFQSVAELKSASIWDLIPDKSQNMFKKFIKKQRKHMDMQQTLLMTMNTTDGTQIRTGVRIAPAVLNKIKCLQIWVHKIEDNLEPVKSKIANKGNEVPASPWENLPATKTMMTQQPIPTGKPHLSNKLKQELSHIKLRLQPLTNTNTSVTKHYLATLVFDVHDQTQITKKLKMSGITDTSIFWDRLLLRKLLIELVDHHQSDNQYLLSLAASSFTDNDYIKFLLKTLKKIAQYQACITFLVSHEIFKNQNQRVKKISGALRAMNSSLGIYNFIPDKLSLRKILTDKPSYLSFSSQWVKRIAEDKNQYNQFIQLTQKLEKTGIQIILS